MVVSDYIMLGRTEPVESKTYGKTVCSAGYSRELGQFMRVYPLTMRNKTSKWSICSIPLERNHRDGRAESWRLDNQHTADDSMITVVGKAKKEVEFDYLASKASASIQELNEKRASLGILFPSEFVPFFDNEGVPRITIGTHNLQLRDWGAAEFRRKGQYSPSELWRSLKLTDSGYEHLFFVGNMQQHRNTWLIISTVMRKREI